MAALLAKPFSAEALAPNFAFTSDGIYVQPAVDTYDGFLAYIRSLPLSQSPEIFGLHENAAITKDLKETRELFESVLCTQAPCDE